MVSPLEKGIGTIHGTLSISAGSSEGSYLILVLLFYDEDMVLSRDEIIAPLASINSNMGQSTQLGLVEQVDIYSRSSCYA